MSFLMSDLDLHDTAGRTLDEGLQLIDQVDQVDDSALQLLTSRESQQLLGQRRSTLCGLHDSIDRPSSTLAVKLTSPSI